MQPGGSDQRSRRLVQASFAVNGLLFLAALAVYVDSRSQLVLAQGSDSLLDLAGGAILVLGVVVASRPRDEGHPFGHERAEPIGALVTAVLAGVLCFEVLRSAIAALLSGERAEVDVYVASVLALKLAAKTALLSRLGRGNARPALRATRVDTRNDVVASASSLVGFGLARAGWSWADAAFALPVAAYIGFNGLALARESLGHLMGAAPERAVLAELESIAATAPGVVEVRSVRAHHVGHRLHVEVTVLVDDATSATAGHDIGVRVRSSVLAHPQVEEAFVHIDTRSAVDHA